MAIYVADPYDNTKPTGGMSAGGGDEELRAIKLILKDKVRPVLDPVDPLDPASLANIVANLQSQITDLQASAVPVGSIVMRAVATTGWLQCSSLVTLGNAASGATNAHATTYKALFLYLWNTYDNSVCVIYSSSGAADIRGADAEADFNANKRISLPEARGEALRAVDAGRGVDTWQIVSTVSNGSNQLTTTDFRGNTVQPGMAISHPRFPGGTTVLGIAGDVVTLSSNADSIGGTETDQLITVTGRGLGTPQADASNRFYKARMEAGQGSNPQLIPEDGSWSAGISGGTAGIGGSAGYSPGKYEFALTGEQARGRNVALGHWLIKY